LNVAKFRAAVDTFGEALSTTLIRKLWFWSVQHAIINRFYTAYFVSNVSYRLSSKELQHFAL